MRDSQWWRDAVIYQIYPRSFADSKGDGYGDLPGITARLPYLAALGVDAIWLSPFYRSPMADAGYDVADYRDVDPMFGTLGDAEAMIARAHELGLRVVVDLVPNHTSDEHAWFVDALAAGPGSPERERYIFRDGRGTSGELPPNNWGATFGGGSWTRITEPDGTPGQWYLHLFDPKQPDLNWDNPEVRDEFVSILRFWLDRGVDGFRVDVAHALVKESGLPDWDDVRVSLAESRTDPGPMWDREEVHDIYRQWHAVLAEYPQRPMLVAEAWVSSPERLARYVRPDEMHQAFNFDLLECHWSAPKYRQIISATLDAHLKVGASPTWVLSNHDVIRHPSRLGLKVPGSRPPGLSVRDEQPDHEIGLRRGLAATMLTLSLPGGAYLYQGEELGLPEATQLPDEVRQDPAWFNSGFTEPGRDGCRVPLPWVADAPGLGFSPTGATWLPQPESFRSLAVDQQEGVPGSVLEFYRSALALRRRLRLGSGTLRWLEGYGDDVLAFVNGSTTVVINISGAPVDLPDGDVVLSSAPLTTRSLPPDTAAWVSNE